MNFCNGYVKTPIKHIYTIHFDIVGVSSKKSFNFNLCYAISDIVHQYSPAQKMLTHLLGVIEQH